MSGVLLVRAVKEWNGDRMGLAVARNVRERRVPAGPEKLAAFEAAVLEQLAKQSTFFRPAKSEDEKAHCKLDGMAF